MGSIPTIDIFVFAGSRRIGLFSSFFAFWPSQSLRCRWCFSVSCLFIERSQHGILEYWILDSKASIYTCLVHLVHCLVQDIGYWFQIRLGYWILVSNRLRILDIGFRKPLNIGYWVTTNQSNIPCCDLISLSARHSHSHPVLCCIRCCSHHVTRAFSTLFHWNNNICNTLVEHWWMLPSTCRFVTVNKINSWRSWRFTINAHLQMMDNEQ